MFSFGFSFLIPFEFVPIDIHWIFINGSKPSAKVGKKTDGIVFEADT